MKSTMPTLLAILVAVASAAHAEAPKPGAAVAPAPAAVEAAVPNPALLDASLATEQAPEKFRVKLNTSDGPIVVEVTRAWSPQGADRFYNLVKIGFFEDIAFFRVIPNFMAQFGIHGDPQIAQVWRTATIQDDPVAVSNERGRVTFAKTGAPNSRATQFFINFKNNSNLDRMGFSPFGEIVEGMEVADAIYKVGEGAPRGPGPNQGRVQSQGNAYLKQAFPDLDYIESAELVELPGASEGAE